MTLSKEKAIKILSRYDSEHYTPATRQAHRMGAEALANAVEVVHGRWERCGGDLHSSGYAIYCSVCNKTHFVHYKYSLGGLYGCKELFEKPKYCPSCGAFMEVEE